MSAVMPQIEHIVYLMMENRSLDNVLGWLYKGRTPNHFCPASNRAPYDGLIEGKYFNPAYSFLEVKQYPVVPIPSEHAKERVPAYDPYEAMWAVDDGHPWKGVMNQLFGSADVVKRMPAKGDKPTMAGFLQDYYDPYMVTWKGLDVLWCYTPKQLPHLNNLAYNFAVSDRWFSSVPTQTTPNRAYSICGTSLGREANSNLMAVEQFDAPTIFNVLGEAGKSWALFFEDHWKNGKCYTEYTFPRISSAANGEVLAMTEFWDRAKQGNLPAFTYLEPKWGYGKGSKFVQGHDYHPPTEMAPGDQFLWKVYSAIRHGGISKNGNNKNGDDKNDDKKSDKKQGPLWENTLLIVTFDEHGGTYDHVAPPWGAVNPDGIAGTRWKFGFDLYGARVPTLLISAFVPPQTVFRAPEGSEHPFDHTSFIKTLLLWAGVDPAAAGLGKRVPVAPSFDGVLMDDRVNEGPQESQISAEPGPPSETGKLFEGMPFASVRWIINQCDSQEKMEAAVAEFKRDPEKFEAALEPAEEGQ